MAPRITPLGNSDGEENLMAVDARVSSRAGFAAAAPVVFLLAASVLAPRPAAAQQALTVDQVRACLCEQQALTVLRQRMTRPRPPMTSARNASST